MYRYRSGTYLDTWVKTGTGNIMAELTAQYKKYNPIQHDTTQCNTTQRHNSTQSNTIKHNTRIT